MDEVTVDAKLREYGLMFSELMKSERFRELVGFYFTFTKIVNEETKEIEFTIIENPPSIIAERMKGKVVEEDNAIQVVAPGQAMRILDKAKQKARKKR